MPTPVADADEVHARLKHGECVVVDCRYDLMDSGAGYRAYLDGHIPGAVYAHLHDDLSGRPVTDHGRHPMPAPERMVELFRSLGINNASSVVVYDASSGSIAARLWWMLRYMGHEAVAVLNGGWQAWTESGYEVEEGEQRAGRGDFSGACRRGMLATLDEVAGLSCLVDCREPARYRGEKEPIDPVAGHIPGAANLYWKRNLDDRGRFLPPLKVRELMQGYLADTRPDEAVFYCGSGVTACFNILAGVYAGLPMSRLYAGSWSEWCSDTGRPVAIGDE